MKSKGFSLIEIMIALAIVAILASVAIPTYQQYLIRTRVLDGLHRSLAAKHAVADYQFTFNALPQNQNQTFYVNDPPSAYVESIVIGEQGTITITYTALAGNGTIILIPFIHPNGDISWDCKTGTLIPDYRPPNCRP